MHCVCKVDVLQLLEGDLRKARLDWGIYQQILTLGPLNFVCFLVLHDKENVLARADHIYEALGLLKLQVIDRARLKNWSVGLRARNLLHLNPPC